jgi:hypothetical protein
MSRSSLAVAVTAFFAVATYVTPIPESYQSYRHFIMWVAWCGLLFSCLAWLALYSREQARTRSTQFPALSPLILLIVVGGGAILAITIWYLTGIVADETRLQEVKKQESTSPPLHGSITPGEEPSLKDKCGEATDGLKVLLGSSVAFAKQYPYTVIAMAGRPVFVVEKDHEGLLVTLDIWDRDGKIVAEIVKNRFVVNPNNYFKIVRDKPNEFIVYDQYKDKVVDIHYLNPSTLKILGKFYYRPMTPLIVTDEGSTYGPVTFSKVCAHDNAGAQFSFK